MALGQKALDLLTIASQPFNSAAWRTLYYAACERYSEKAVLRKFDELDDRGYIESGVTSRSGWLTAKGRAALEAAGITITTMR